jgi:hypothetical protein
MVMTIEERLSCAKANNNALKEEIDGLHLYIDSLRAKLGMPPKFKGNHASQQANAPDAQGKCECGGEWRTDGEHQNEFCSVCFKSRR